MELYGQKIINWKAIDKIPPDKRKEKILEAIAVFSKRIAKKPLQSVKMTGPDSSFAANAPVIQTFTSTIATPDRGYELLFTEVDMRASSSSTFEIMDINGGITFYQQITGEEAKLSRLPTGAKGDVGMVRFTGGFAILDDWLRFNQFYKIDDLTSNTFTSWYNKKATLFYGLISALDSTVNQSFDTDDVTTINNACSKIIVDLEAAGYSLEGNKQFYIVCHTNLKQRIYKALAASFMLPNTNNEQIVWSIKGIIETSKIAATSFYVAIPGLKNKRGEWEDFNQRPATRNELKLAADYVWTGAYNGAIGDKRQFRRCSLS